MPARWHRRRAGPRCPRPPDGGRGSSCWRQLESCRNRTQGTIEPERTPQVVRAWSRPCLCHPLLVGLVREIGVDDDVAVGIARSGFLEMDPLVPAVHAADGIRLHRERQVLVDADLAPPDAPRVRIGTLEGGGAVHLLHDVASTLFA